MPTSDPPGPGNVPLESVPCDLCGADDPVPILTLRDRLQHTTDQPFRLVACRRCGLRYLNPRPTAETLGRYYPAQYAPFARSRIASRLRLGVYRSEVRALQRWLAAPRRVLDLGCGTGDLLQTVRELGNPNVMGIEPNRGAAATARAHWGLVVAEGNLEDVELPDGAFDTVLLSHVIEHLPSPSQTLDRLRRLLTPGGALILWLPNVESAAARWFRQYWIGYDAPRHLYDFSPATLEAMLERHGFVIRSIHHEWIGLEWAWAFRLWVAERAGGHALTALLARLHPALIVGLTPLSLLAALSHQAGRVRVVALRAPT